MKKRAMLSGVLALLSLTACGGDGGNGCAAVGNAIAACEAGGDPGAAAIVAAQCDATTCTDKQAAIDCVVEVATNHCNDLDYATQLDNCRTGCTVPPQ